MPLRRRVIKPGMVLIIALSLVLSGFIWPLGAQASTSKPTVTTNSASSISTTYATLNGKIDSDGNLDITEYGFYYGTGSDPASSGTRVKVGTSINEGKSFSKKITGLKSGKKYYFTAYAKNSKGTQYGSVKYFTTKSSGSEKPDVETDAATSIGDNYATLNGYLDSDGDDDITDYGFYWGTSSSPGTKHSLGSGLNEDEAFHYRLTDLDEDTKYYFKAYAKNSEGTSYGEVLSFRTSSGSDDDKPQVTTDDATNIDEDSATLKGEIDSAGDSDIEEYGFYYGTSSSPSTKKTVGTDELDAGDDFKYTLSGLASGTRYYFKAYAKNDDGTGYGDVLSFTTEGDSGAPSVTTKTPSTSSDYATLYGVVTDRGDSDIESYGFYWGTSSSPGTKVEVDDEDIDEDKTFSYKLKDLNPGTTYYVKAYARNDDGTSYGSVLSFKTDGSAEPAKLTTKVSDISAAGATLTGKVASTGGGAVSEYGFVWGKSGGSETRIKVGSSIAVDTNFVYFLGGLQSGTGYYAKAYAVTSAGTAYGDKVEFTTSSTGTISPASPVSGAPVVVISSPAPNSSVVRGTALNIYASASDDVGVVAMGLYVNGVQKIRPSGSALAYSLDTSSLPLGTCAIRVTAWDGSKAGEQAIIINIQSGTASSGAGPSVSITSPASGYRVYAGNPVEIAASSDARAQAMGLYINGVKKMRCGGAFFNYYLDTKGMSPGTYTIRVTAWDGTRAGEKTVSLVVQ